ncbi:class I adenylate-forming enzyme family protein [Pseudonocardia broussonetiae]|uniref:AMP-binding protein n=1 Tax=Pseudonocardia broussonetiae TaxID=2736640 RepID=A0A6M6JRF2_9PSEU|nr:AMP-binding protein [Pseudonocardia broussonetiae]QJY48861.1 AMP-binding protein [Pseudonocardia broussonetiae]
MRITEFFDRGLRQNPDGAAYVMDGRRWTYRESYALSCRVAHGLTAALRPGAKVAVLSPNHPEAWICVLATWRAGMVWVPLNPAVPAAETADLAASLGCEAILYHSSLGEVVELLRDRVPELRLAVCLDRTDDDRTDDRTPWLHDWCGDLPSEPPAVDTAFEDIVAIPPTGGTTGLPKGVLNNHRGITTSTALLMMLLDYEAHQPIVNLAAAPMTHTSGFLSLPATARGGTVVVLDKADPAVLADVVEEHGVTEMFLPPTVIYRWLDHLRGQQRDFSSLRYLIYGSAPMSVDRLREAIGVFGPVMTSAYGQTEAPGTIALMRCAELFDADGTLNEARLSACGRPSPLLSVELRDDDDRPVPRGAEGEICVRGDTVMVGYHELPDRTAETVVGGWLHTGDVGRLDDDGYLHITDRKKDMIISGGFNVFPSEVEQVLWRHPAVGDCAVVGAPHPDWGEQVTAVVELRAGASATPEELVAWCRGRLGGVRTPKRIDIVDELPRSHNGKVLRNRVRETYWQGAGRRI